MMISIGFGQNISMKGCLGKGKGMKLIGVYTKNFPLYHDLLKALGIRNVDYMVLADPKKIPSRVGVVITTSLEKEKIKGKKLVIADCYENAIDAVDRAIHILRGGGDAKDIFIGVDPGEYPGVALLYGEKVIQTWCADSIDKAIVIINDIVAEQRGKGRLTIRIGHGSLACRDRILGSLVKLKVPIEIVDETSTTPQRGLSRLERNERAAVRIGSTPGKKLESYRRTRKPTKGEIREIQARSRILSGGKITISEELAKKVLKGEITIEEAIKM